MTKRKFDDLMDSFESMNISQKCTTLAAPSTKRRNYKVITVSKINLVKYKNIFGLETIPEKDFFTRQEVESLLDKRDKLLYKKYLDIININNVNEKIINVSNQIV
tara:strand:- start:2162 stop:2476 length:315 start_codon:yes stop_codon:yes gene_type:complete